MATPLIKTKLAVSILLHKAGNLIDGHLEGLRVSCAECLHSVLWFVAEKVVSGLRSFFINLILWFIWVGCAPKSSMTLLLSHSSAPDMSSGAWLQRNRAGTIAGPRRLPDLAAGLLGFRAVKSQLFELGQLAAISVSL